MLQGTEVKALRAGSAQLKDAYASVRDGELWLHNLHIPPYGPAARDNHEPERPRKLLVHKREIERLVGKTQERGLDDVPTRLYFKRPPGQGRDRARARTRNRFDKRESIKSARAEPATWTGRLASLLRGRAAGRPTSARPERCGHMRLVRSTCPKRRAATKTRAAECTTSRADSQQPLARRDAVVLARPGVARTGSAPQRRHTSSTAKSPDSRMIGSAARARRDEREAHEPHPRGHGREGAAPSSGVTGRRLKRFRKNPVKASASSRSLPSRQPASATAPAPSVPRTGPASPTRASAAASSPSDLAPTTAPRKGMNRGALAGIPSRRSWIDVAQLVDEQQQHEPGGEPPAPDERVGGRR